MPNFVNTNLVSFNGVATTADQFSNPVDLTGQISARPHGWFWQLNATANGLWAVTLQFNPDPLGVTQFGWQDESSTGITVLNTITCANLGQTNGGIYGGVIRAGVLNVTTSPTSFSLLLSFNPKPYVYRLRFQINNTFVGNIPKISFSTGV